MADISTNQPRASRPRIGPERETTTQKIIAFFGVLCFRSIRPNQAGRKPSWAIEYIRRDEAR